MEVVFVKFGGIDICPEHSVEHPDDAFYDYPAAICKPCWELGFWKENRIS